MNGDLPAMVQDVARRQFSRIDSGALGRVFCAAGSSGNISSSSGIYCALRATAQLATTRKLSTDLGRVQRFSPRDKPGCLRPIHSALAN